MLASSSSQFAPSFKSTTSENPRLEPDFGGVSAPPPPGKPSVRSVLRQPEYSISDKTLPIAVDIPRNRTLSEFSGFAVKDLDSSPFLQPFLR